MARAFQHCRDGDAKKTANCVTDAVADNKIVPEYQTEGEGMPQVNDPGRPVKLLQLDDDADQECNGAQLQDLCHGKQQAQ